MQRTKLNDEALVERALRDLDAFEELLERYEAKLLNYILKITNFSKEEAQEILQEAFVKVWENLNSFDTSLKFSSWIYRIVHNASISAHRKEKNRDKKIHLSEQLSSLLPSKEERIELKLDRSWESEKVQSVFKKMDQKHREVLVLKFIEEFSYEEISDILKVPMGSVASQINRAKKKFKTLYEKH